jgi:EpsD family peptidyl-prolyl cis-trans isomerase
MNRKLTLLAGSVLVLAMAGGCQKHVGGQVVAVVNGNEITQQEFNAELGNAPPAPTADKQAVMSRVLQGLVDRKLLVQQAKADGIDRSPEYLNQIMRMQDELAVNLLAAKLSKKIAVPDKDAIAHFIAENPTMFSGRKRYALDQVVFPASVDPKTLHDLEPVHSLDAVAGVLTSHGVQFTRGKGQLDTATMPKGLADRITALPPGEPFVLQNKGQFVASAITSVNDTPTPDAQSAAIAMNALRQKSVSDAVLARLATAKSSAKIEYAQGFAPKPN